MRKRYKLLIIIFISFILVLIIYKLCYKPKYMYLFIGANYNNLSTYDFNDRIKYELKDNKLVYKEILEPFIIDEYVEMLTNNKHNINYYLKNANLIVISIGVNELNNYKEIDSSIIIEYLNNMYRFLNKIRDLNSKDIFLINMYSSDYKLINDKIKKYTAELKIYYIDENIIDASNSFFIKDDMYLSNKGHKNIGDYILKRIKI